MFRLISRGMLPFLFIFLLAPAGYSKTPAGNADKDVASADATASAPPSSDTIASASANGDEAASSNETTADASAPPAQAASKDKKSDPDYKPAPIFTPTLATTGTLGMFTLETGDTLPKGGFAVSAFGNKFGRMPGSVTILEIGVDASYGITDTLNAYATFDPYGHVHVECPGQLSLRSIPLATGNCTPVNFGTPASNSF